RQADDVLYQALTRGQFCYVLDTRQVGKSSLLVRTAQRLQREGKATIAAFDLSALGHNLSVEQWFAGLLYALADQIGGGEEIETFWDHHQALGPAQRWIQAVAETLRRWPDLPLVLLFDEIDAVRRLPFSTDEFFAGIRGCYERRSFDPALN